MSDLHVVHWSGFWPQLTTLLDTVYLFIETSKFRTEKNLVQIRETPIVSSIPQWYKTRHVILFLHFP